MSGILFLVLFGIVQYGLYFNDSLNTRQGVREAVRQGVVQMPIANSCGGSGVTWAKLDCYTKKQIGAITGSAKVHFEVPDTDGWKKPNRAHRLRRTRLGLGLRTRPDAERRRDHVEDCDVDRAGRRAAGRQPAEQRPRPVRQ